jgi:hypothetical protein
MKTVAITLLLVMGIISYANAQNYMTRSYYDSGQLSSEWNNYVNDPSEGNALKVYNLLPEKGHVRKEDSDLDLEKKIYKNLTIIENRINQKKGNSVKLAFRLFTISDGAFTEELCIMLGHLIRLDPSLFLTELKEHYHLVHLPVLLCNYGPDYWDSQDKVKIETQERIKFLEMVQNKGLNDLREECIGILSQYLEKLN